MGNKVTTFTDQQLECYQDCTYFTRKEIITVFKRFRDLDPNKIPKIMADEDCHNIRVSQDKLERMPDLKENPLKERICKVFSSDGSGNMTFDDFLNMCSLFNEQCPRNTKIHYAFQIYDYDGDGFIGMDDLKKTLVSLTKSRLSQDEVEIVCSKVMDEADHDNDGQISFLEFKHVVSRSPDFMR